MSKPRAYKDPKCTEANRQGKEWRASWYYDYKKHQEEILYSRVNIFMVAVSILAAALVAVQEPLLRLFVAFLGLASTAFWYLAVKRQKEIVGDLRLQLEDADCLYKEMKRFRDRRDEKLKRRISGHWLLFFYLPLIFGVFWILAVVWSFNSLPKGP